MDTAEKVVNIIFKLAILVGLIFFLKTEVEKSKNGRFVLVSGSNSLTAYIIDTQTGKTYRLIGEQWSVYDPINQSHQANINK